MENIKDWRLMRADEIEVREGHANKAKTKKCLLLYKDARCDMDRLDELGQFNWQREHKDVHGVSYCGVSIWDKEKQCWVTKWDAGERSQTSPEKGEASDSFKRACVNWGIGRELYTAPQVWVDYDIEANNGNLVVSAIEYNDNREIIALVIKDRKGNEVWRKGQPKNEPHPYVDAAKTKLEEQNRAMLEKIQAVTTAIELQELQHRLDNKPLAEDRKAEFQKAINEQGGKINATRTADGWVSNTDLFGGE